MPDLLLDSLPAPRPCGLCGRPTTSYHPRLGIAYCGREEGPATRSGRTGAFAPAVHGGRHGWRRRTRA